MKYIKLFYWNGKNKYNFGDEVSPYVIKKLSDKDVIFRKPTFKGFVFQLASAFKDRDWRLLGKLIITYRLNEKIVLGVGSLLAVSNKKTIAWGAGFMDRKSVVSAGTFLAIRGELSRNLLLEYGLKAPNIFGDAALLLPLVYRPDVKRNKESKTIGIIPHFSEYEYFYNKYNGSFNVIDLKTNEVEKVIDLILECDYILSSSLHGIIVAHAYEIPALWIEKKELEPEGFKFHDYFTSVGIEPYDGFSNLDVILQNRESAIQLFLANENIMRINNSLMDIQKGLLKVAPFEIKRKINFNL